MSKWQGIITLGTTDSARLITDILQCLSMTDFRPLTVEPARIFSAVGNARRGLEVWNRNRTYLNADPDCVNVPQTNQETMVLRYAGQPDEIRLAGGYQTLVQQRGTDGVFISSAPGGGEILDPGGEIPLYDGESVNPGRDFLDGGTDCTKVLRTINGVAGPNVEIAADTGVVVGNHRDLNRIVINANGEGLNFCAPDQDDTVVECLPSGQLGCGPLNDQAYLCPGPPDPKAGFLATYQYGDNVDFSNSGSVPLPQALALTNLQLYGSCQYRRESSGWILEEDSPCGVCSCQEPSQTGYIGQTLTIPAIPLPVEAPFHVRNPYLTDAQYWNHTGVGFELMEPSDEDLFDGLTYAEIEAGTLFQAPIPLDYGRYRVQFQHSGIGDFTVRVLNARTSLEILLETDTAGMPSIFMSEFFEVTTDAVELLITASDIINITEIGIVKWH